VDESQKNNDELGLPALEEVSAQDTPAAGYGTLISEDVSHMAGKLAVLESTYKLLTRDLKFQDFMRELLMISLRVIKSEAGSVLEVNHSDKTIFFRTAVGVSSDRIVRFLIPMGQGIVGHVAESLQTVVVSDMDANQVHLKSIERAVGFRARNLVAAPIMVRGRIYGVIELLNRVGEQGFTQPDIELINFFCETAGRAIEIRLMIAWASKHKKEAA
jgi:GAF domain-containing protein